MDADADEDLLMREALFFPIENCSRSVEAGPAHLNIVDQLVFASDVEERVLLPCEASVRKVLGGRAGPHRHLDRFGSCLLA